MAKPASSRVETLLVRLCVVVAIFFTVTQSILVYKLPETSTKSSRKSRHHGNHRKGVHKSVQHDNDDKSKIHPSSVVTPQKHAATTEKKLHATPQKHITSEKQKHATLQKHTTTTVHRKDVVIEKPSVVSATANQMATVTIHKSNKNDLHDAGHNNNKEQPFLEEDFNNTGVLARAYEPWSSSRRLPCFPPDSDAGWNKPVLSHETPGFLFMKLMKCGGSTAAGIHI
jgi:hypothetical protein